MHCPFCSENDTKVIDSRLVADGHQVRRRRQCLGCNERFTTFETAELVMPRVIKSNGNHEPLMKRNDWWVAARIEKAPSECRCD